MPYYLTIKALKWNKIEIASNDIFNGKEEFTSKQMNKVLEMALVYDRPGFVELILENKINLDNFLTSKRLFYLYNCINVSFSPSYKTLNRIIILFDLQRIKIREKRRSETYT